MRDAGELDRRREGARQQGETAQEREQTRDRLTSELSRRSEKASEAAQHALAAENELHAAQDTAGRAPRRRGARRVTVSDRGLAEDPPRARARGARSPIGRLGRSLRPARRVAARSSALDKARAGGSAHRSGGHRLSLRWSRPRRGPRIGRRLPRLSGRAHRAQVDDGRADRAGHGWARPAMRTRPDR